MKQAKIHNYALIEQVGRMYYILQMNQQTIADKLGLSRTTVVRLLAEGREEGIIQIYICGQDRGLRHTELETELQKRYHLRDIVIARNSGPNAIYNVAAKYIQGIVPEKGILAISGGKTMYTVADYFYPVDREKELNIVQLTGVFGDGIPGMSVAQRWSEKLNSNVTYLSAPGIVSTPGQRQLFMNEFHITKAYEAIREAEMTISGIGTPKVVLENISADYPKERFERLEQDCVGDIMFHFYNARGEFNAPGISECVVGATIEDYMKIPNRVAIAFGSEKTAAIHAAMKGGIVNIMITDEETARELGAGDF